MDEEKVISPARSPDSATTPVVRPKKPADLRSDPGTEPRTRIDAERVLREALAALLSAYPSSDDPDDEVEASFWNASVSVMASVDSVLVRHEVFVSELREKVCRLREIVSNEDLLRIVDHALAIQLHERLSMDLDARTFWQGALRFHLDSFLGLLMPAGSTRSRQLVNLLESFHYHSVAWRQRAYNVARAVFGLNARQQIERLLLGLALEKHPEMPSVDLRWLARKAGISVELGWKEMVNDAVARWRQLSGVLE